MLSEKRRARLRRPAFLGTLRRTSPLSDRWGSDRGTPVDRYFIESFLRRNRDAIRGRVLEVKEDLYTSRLGVHVDYVEILDIDDSNPKATIVADLADWKDLPDEGFDCVVITQTLHLIYAVAEAVENCRRLIRPGGTVLATVPAVSRTAGDWDCWRMTPLACRRLFSEVFGAANVQVDAFGNVLTCVAFLEGLAAEELRRAQLEEYDERFPLITAVRAVRS